MTPRAPTDPAAIMATARALKSNRHVVLAGGYFPVALRAVVDRVELAVGARDYIWSLTITATVVALDGGSS